MLLTKQQFYKRYQELIKLDNSCFNVVMQIIHDFELNPTEVGEWIKDDKTLVDSIESEFKINSDINDLF